MQCNTHLSVQVTFDASKIRRYVVIEEQTSDKRQDLSLEDWGAQFNCFSSMKLVLALIHSIHINMPADIAVVQQNM
jgi:hypothetical protein